MVGWWGRRCSPLLQLLLVAVLLDTRQALRTNALPEASRARLLKPSRALFQLAMSSRENSPTRHPLTHFNKSFLSFDGGEQIMIEYDQTSKDRVWYAPSELISNNATEVLNFWKEKRLAEAQLRESIEKGEVDMNKHFAKYRSFLSVEKAEVLQMNHDFYLAWQNGYNHIMRNLWSRMPNAICAVAGNRNVVTGYDNITHFWAGATRPPDQPLLTKVMLHFWGDVAAVTSTLEMHSKKGGQMLQALHCVNLFVRDRDQGRYFLWAHLGTNSDAPRDGYKDPTRKPTRRKDRRLEGLREKLLGLAEQRAGHEDPASDPREGGDAASEGRGLPSLPHFLLSLMSSLNPSLGGRGFPPPGLPIVVMQPRASAAAPPTLPLRGGASAELGDGRKGSGSREDADDEHSEGGEDDERDEALAAATVSALQHLYMAHRITRTEKQTLTADIVQHVNTGSLSKVEIAMAVLIGGVRPGEAGLSEALPRDVSLVEDEDLRDFEHICHRVARELLETP